MVEALEQAVEDLLSGDLAFVLGVVALGLDGGSELDCGDEEGAGLADRLEVVVGLDWSAQWPLPSMRRRISPRGFRVSLPSSSGSSRRGWSKRPRFDAAPVGVQEDEHHAEEIDDELKARALRLVNDHQGEHSSLTAAAAVVAKQLGVGEESVRRWVLQAQIDGGQRAGASSGELAEIKALKAENRRPREDVEILRGATAFFVGELDPRNR